MLELSTNSWHYRFATRGTSWGPSSSLCPYMREVMFGLLLTIVVITITETVLLGNILALAAFVQGVYGFVGDGTPWFMFVHSLTIALLIVAAILYAINWFIDTRQEKCRAAYRKARLEAEAAGLEYDEWNLSVSTPNIFVEWYRAWHDKVCPRIDFK